MNILLTGASGFIGSALRAHLHAHRVYGLTRQKPAELNWAHGFPVRSVESITEPVEAVINLAGENIGARRWTDARKSALRQSRIDLTRRLAQQLRNCGQRPKLWINASAVGYYGDRPGQPLDEDSAAAQDFAAQLCSDWEAATHHAADELRVSRRCILRLGVVLGRGGMLRQLQWPFRLGLGAVMGPGHQHMAWIGLNDVCSVIETCLADSRFDGTMNLVAPTTNTQQEFAKGLGNQLGRPVWMRLPAPVLRILMGQMADLILFDQQVQPWRLQQLGYQFQHPHLDSALAAALKPHD